MIHKHQLIQLITKFLRTEENALEREELINWYDQQSTQDQHLTEHASILEKSAKSRLLNSINRSKRTKIKMIRIRYAAAASVLILGIASWLFFLSNKDQIKLATENELANVQPAQERAIITLENGQEIELDKLKINETIQIGNIIISKDEQGKVSYHDADSKKESIQLNTLHVPKASIYSLVLTDGTKVTLNAGSKLIYPSSFTDGDRKVFLEGEGYFEVSKTEDRSRFIVSTAKQQVTVLGTKFNMKAYPEELKNQTALAEGIVSVSNLTIAETPKILKPNQQATNVKSSPLTTETIEIENVIGWTKGQFCFDGKNTTSVFEEIARWYDVDIDYSNYQSNSAQYKGKIPRNLSLDKLIKLLNFAEIKTQASLTNNKRIKLQLN